MNDYGPEFDAFVERVHEKLVPKIMDSSIFVSITPSSPDKVDVKFAVELGLAIMLDKPIIAVVSPGDVIPEKLDRVVDHFVEIDWQDPSSRERLAAAIEELHGELDKNGNGS